MYVVMVTAWICARDVVGSGSSFSSSIGAQLIDGETVVGVWFAAVDGTEVAIWKEDSDGFGCLW